MNKQEFLEELRKALSGVPQDDVEERLSFYGEMIDDRMEEGASEEEAVDGIGPVEDVAAQMISEIPLTKIVREKITPKRSLRGGEILLIVLGFPLWFPLLIAFFAVCLALYIVLWALDIALWAVWIALGACALAGMVAMVVYFIQGVPVPAVAALGCALFCAGIAIFLFRGCIAATKGIARLTKKIALGIKKKIIRKGKEK